MNDSTVQIQTECCVSLILIDGDSVILESEMWHKGNNAASFRPIKRPVPLILRVIQNRWMKKLRETDRPRFA